MQTGQQPAVADAMVGGEMRGSIVSWSRPGRCLQLWNPLDQTFFQGFGDVHGRAS